MSQICALCGKKPGFGFNVSHSHRKTKRRWSPNIQKIRVSVNGTPAHMNVCTKCMKAGKAPRR